MGDWIQGLPKPRAVRWQSCNQNRTVWRQSPSNSVQCTGGSVILLKMRLRARCQIKCKLSFYSPFKDSPSKQIPRNPQCTLVPWEDLTSTPQDHGAFRLGGSFLPIGRIRLPGRGQFIRVRGFVEGKPFGPSDGPGPSSRDAMLIPSLLPAWPSWLLLMQCLPIASFRLFVSGFSNLISPRYSRYEENTAQWCLAAVVGHWRVLEGSLGPHCGAALYYFTRTATAKHRRLGGLNNRNYFFMVLEAGSPRSRGWWSWFLLMPLSLAYHGHFFPVSSCRDPSVGHILGFPSSSCKDIGHIGLGSTLMFMTLLNVNYFFKDPIFKYSYIRG